MLTDLPSIAVCDKQVFPDGAVPEGGVPFSADMTCQSALTFTNAPALVSRNSGDWRQIPCGERRPSSGRSAPLRRCPELVVRSGRPSELA